MSEFVRNKIRHSYSLHFDYDQNGLVDENDITVGLKKVAVLKNLKEGDPKYKELEKNVKSLWKNMMDHADANSDGIVTPEEWMKMWMEFVENPTKPREWMKLYRDIAYYLADLNDDGHITCEEFVKVHTAYGTEKEDVELAFRKAAGSNTVITKKFFFEHWFQYFISEDKNEPGNYLLGTTKFGN